MKIKKIETILTSPGINFLIVKITTDEGIVGYGDATLGGRTLAVQSVINDHIADWLVGCDANQIEDVWQMIFKSSYWRGGPILMDALAGIDMALWDIKGKKAKMPLYSLLGGKCRDRVLIYKHVHGSTSQELIEKCHNEVDNGIRVLRYSFDSKDPFMELGLLRQPHQDLSEGRIEVNDVKNQVCPWDSGVYINDLINITGSLRNDLGENVGLIHDVHGRLSSVGAARVAKELEPFHLYFLEDPVDHWDKKAFLHLKSNTVTPLAIGELYNTVNDCTDLISGNLIDYIRVDITHYGGITPLIKLAAFAEIFGVKTAFHGPSDISPIAHAAMTHVNFATINFGIQEHVDFDDTVCSVFNSSLKRDQGYLYLSEKPGLGITINENLANSYPYQRKHMPISRDRAGAICNW